MRFSALAQYVRRLDATTSRTALVAILTELVGATSPEEIAPTTYLLQGRLAPAFMPLEMGLGSALIAETIARAFQESAA